MPIPAYIHTYIQHFTQMHCSSKQCICRGYNTAHKVKHWCLQQHSLRNYQSLLCAYIHTYSSVPINVMQHGCKDYSYVHPANMAYTRHSHIGPTTKPASNHIVHHSLQLSHALWQTLDRIPHCTSPPLYSAQGDVIPPHTAIHWLAQGCEMDGSGSSDATSTLK